MVEMGAAPGIGKSVADAGEVSGGDMELVGGFAQADEAVDALAGSVGGQAMVDP